MNRIQEYLKGRTAFSNVTIVVVVVVFAILVAAALTA